MLPGIRLGMGINTVDRNNPELCSQVIEVDHLSTKWLPSLLSPAKEDDKVEEKKHSLHKQLKSRRLVKNKRKQISNFGFKSPLSLGVDTEVAPQKDSQIDSVQIIYDNRGKQYEQYAHVFQTQFDLEKEFKGSFFSQFPNLLGANISAHLSNLKAEKKSNLLLSILIHGIEGKTFLKPGSNYKLKADVENELKGDLPDNLESFVEGFTKKNGNAIVTEETWGRGLWLILEFDTSESSKKSELTAELQFSIKDIDKSKMSVSESLSDILKIYQFKMHYVVYGWDLSISPEEIIANDPKKKTVEWNSPINEDDKRTLTNRLLNIVNFIHSKDLPEPVLLGYETQPYVKFVEKSHIAKALAIQNVTTTAQGLFDIATRLYSLCTFLLSSVSFSDISLEIMSEFIPQNETDIRVREEVFPQPKFGTTAKLKIFIDNIRTLEQIALSTQNHIENFYYSIHKLKEVAACLSSLSKQVQEAYEMQKPKAIYIPLKRFYANTIHSCLHNKGEFHEKLPLPVGTKFIVITRSDPLPTREVSLKCIDSKAMYDMFLRKNTDKPLNSLADYKRVRSEHQEMIAINQNEAKFSMKTDRILPIYLKLCTTREEYNADLKSWKEDKLRQIGDTLFIKNTHTWDAYICEPQSKNSTARVSAEVTFLCVPINPGSFLGKKLAMITPSSNIHSIDKTFLQALLCAYRAPKPKLKLKLSLPEREWVRASQNWNIFLWRRYATIATIPTDETKSSAVPITRYLDAVYVKSYGKEKGSHHDVDIWAYVAVLSLRELSHGNAKIPTDESVQHFLELIKEYTSPIPLSTPRPLALSSLSSQTEEETKRGNLLNIGVQSMTNTAVTTGTVSKASDVCSTALVTTQLVPVPETDSKSNKLNSLTSSSEAAREAHSASSASLAVVFHIPNVSGSTVRKILNSTIVTHDKSGNRPFI